MNVVNQPIVKHKLGLLNLAEELGNVSQACKIMGVLRDTFYRYHEAKGSTPITRTVLKRLKTLNHSLQLVAAYADYENAQCS